MTYLKTIVLAMFLGASFLFQSIPKKEKAYYKMLDKLLSHSVEEIRVNQLTDSLQVIWLDAREKKEYDVSKIYNAQWVGYDDFDLKRVGNIAKDEDIIVYCSVGYRSEKIAEKLKEAGFLNVRNFYGGIFSWVNNDRIVYDSLEQPTDKVHAYDRVWGVWLNKGEKVY